MRIIIRARNIIHVHVHVHVYTIPDESRDTPYLNPEMAGERKVPSIREEEEEEGSISNHVPSLSERLGKLSH